MKNLHVALVAVIVNGSILLWFSTNPHIPNGETPTLGEASQAFLDRQQCLDIDNRDSDECKVEKFPTMLPPGLHPYSQNDADDDEDEAVEARSAEDPLLEQMPTADFKAYKRKDISSMYQELPGTRIERTPKFCGIAAKFVNMSPERLDLMWDNGQGPPGDLLAHAGPFESGGTSTFPNHLFYFIKPKTKEVVCSMRVRKGTSVYYCDPFIETDEKDLSAGVLYGPPRSFDTLSEEERNLYNAALYNREFGSLYEDFTGSPWYGQFPQEAPRHHMHRADHFGQEHTISTVESQFTSLPPEDELYRKRSVEEMMRNETSSLPFQEYRKEGKMDITIKAVSVEPRIFQIDGFLSEVEVDHIIELANRKKLRRSTTGSGNDMQVSNVRTSQTTWLPRHYSPIMDAVIKRAADVLKIDEALFRHRQPGEHPELPSRIPINEDLQIVHYNNGAQYTTHTDHGYPDTRPNAPSRSINLCVYLNEGMEGGETAFPRWRNAETDDAIKAVPKKGKAMIFYMKNPDGNLDGLSQHAAMPVIEGEKWFANLWTWDPFRE